MKILRTRPGRPGGRVRALIDAQLENGVILRQLRLIDGRNGLRVFGPDAHGETVIALPPAVADAIAEAVADVRT
jgi:DNA-binding cell septation regulator SpoVG